MEPILPTRRQKIVTTAPHPQWMRVTALLALLLAVFAGCGQAVHMHGDMLPHHAAQVEHSSASPLNGSDVDCPLCVAMHAVLATPVRSNPVPVAVAQQRVPEEEEGPARTDWHFILFSRPPPVASL